MSCEIRLTATIQNIPAIRRCLFPTDDHRGSDNWLQTCKISPSPTGDLIALANERRLVILNSKWDSATSLSVFQIGFSDSVHEYDKVKAVLCLPIVGESQNSHVGPDWTCIVIGFDSGYVRFYTERCDLLMEEQFHNENISNIKCQSQHSPRPDISPELHHEELYIQYQSNVCVLNGPQLFENLKNCRSQLARGYHYALEGANQPVLSDVAKAVASKLKSALPGWLTGTKQNETKEVTIAMQPVDVMGLRFGLCDLRRTCSEIVLSPNRKLAAVSDTLGRVLLVDSFKGIIIKNFKGYREAQCAFLQIPDDRRSKHRIGNKVALFLVIYSPKKGTLEIFTVQQGTKIATFSASKYSRLLYITHGLMGFTVTSKSRYICQFTCIFIDGDGHIREISVPFHYALAEKNSVKARDIHLYKKIRQYVKTGCLSIDSLENEIYNISTELKTSEIKAQMVDMLLSSRGVSPEAILRCVEYFLEQPMEVVDDTTTNLKVVCKNVKALLELYLFVTLRSENHESGNSEEISKKASDNALNLDPRDLAGLQKLLDLATSSGDQDLKSPRVKFSDEVSFSVSDFLASFDLSGTEGVVLKANVEEDRLFKTSEVLFKKYISGECKNFDDFSCAILSSTVPIKQFFDLLIQFWVNRSLDISLNLTKDMTNISNVITMLIKLASKEIMWDIEHGSLSTFWENIREILANNSRPFPALMAAMLCKSVVQRYELENSEENIEVLTQENIQWSLLIGKLEDVSTLNIILSSKPKYQNISLPKLSHEKVDVSLKYILQHGRGSVSELTAQWLTSCGIEPLHIVVNEVIYFNNQRDSSEKLTNPENIENQIEDFSEKLNEIQICEGMHLETIEQVKSEPIFKYLNLLKQQFPYSLEASCLLANMCWEYALSWRKDITNLEHLTAALRCASAISNYYVKKGLIQLIWNTHLKIVLECSCKLINKVGKLPKDRLCKQDTGLSDKKITEFIGICRVFMDTFLAVARKNCDSPKPELKFEAIWEGGGPQPLVELAVQQKDVDYNLLHLHYQLCLVLYMITKFTVKHSKPVNNLFEASLATLFFTDLQRQIDTNWNKSDIKTNSSREDFLKKIVTSSMETVTLDESGQIFCKDHVEWMDKCLTLARIWNLDIDSLRRFQITLLYISGYDLIAHELVPAISEKNLLGVELLKVAGNRLSQYLSSTPNLSENIAALSPMLSRYIETLNGTWCSPSDLNNITNLGNLVLQCLNEDDKEYYKLAELLLDACNTLEEINRH